MNDIERISVIVPVYKTEKYIKTCIDSLKSQDYSNCEIILVDDGSPDCCGNICDEYASQNSNIKVIHQKNSGASAARNSGLRIATGQYITFVDSDDWVDTNYLSTLVQHMRPGGMAVCGIVVEKCNDQNRKKSLNDCCLESTILMNRMQAELSILNSNGVGGFVCSKMFDKSIIDTNKLSFSEDITLCEDHLFLMGYLSCSADEIICVNQKLYHYRMNPESAFGSRMQRKDCFDKRLFSNNVALMREKQYLEPSQKVLSALNARLVEVASQSLLLMEMNGWRDNPLYRVYLKRLRRGFWNYLCSNIGESAKSKLLVFLCCINPRLCCFIKRIFINLKSF